MTDILKRLRDSSSNESIHELQCRCFSAADEIQRNRNDISDLVAVLKMFHEHVMASEGFQIGNPEFERVSAQLSESIAEYGNTDKGGWHE